MTQDSYEVNFDMKTSYTVCVKAENPAAAKKKAFKLFEKKRNQRSAYEINVNNVPVYNPYPGDIR